MIIKSVSILSLAVFAAHTQAAELSLSIGTDKGNTGGTAPIGIVLTVTNAS